MHILWVENHQQFSQFAVKQFLSAYAVTIVPSLAAARLALAQQQFDVILLDYDLDDGKGTELVTEIKGLSNRPALIAASSHAAGNQSLVNAGADAVCGKMEFASIAKVIAQTIE